MKILFVCQANVCRSVVAQELCKKYLPQAEVVSRGIYVTGQNKVPSIVRSYLAEQGINLTVHVPTQISAQDMQTADWVFCMEPQQLEQLTDMYAQYTDKIWLLNDFVYEKETPVEDPLGLSEKAAHAQLENLQQTLVLCARRLETYNTCQEKVRPS